MATTFGASSPDQWLREVMNRELLQTLASLDPSTCDAVEVSGDLRDDLPWRRYTSLTYPEFDLCRDTPTETRDTPTETYDIVICEQVLEHVIDPWRAARTLAALCREDGHLVVSVPFLLRIHGSPSDYWRMTPAGLRAVMEAAGLEVCWVHSWGNRRAVRGNLRKWLPYRPWRSLRNREDTPLVVWALARHRR